MSILQIDPSPFRLRFSTLQWVLLQSGEPETSRGFRLSSVRARIGKANGAMSGLHPYTDAPTDKPARELASGITGTEQNGDVTISPTIRGALEIEARPYGCGSVKAWPKSGISPAWLV